MITGLLTQKPGRDPVVGDVKNYVVIQMPAIGGKKAWTKIKNPSQTEPGLPHKIVSVVPTGHTDSYGNVSFNIGIEPALGVAPTQTAPVQSTRNTSGMSKDDYWTRKEQRDIEGVARMGRAHAQEMSLRFFQIHGGMPGANTPAEITEKLRKMIDWFERDVQNAQHGEESQ